MSVGVSILAYGEEHINECKLLLNQLSNYDLKFYVTTNTPESFEGFNINLITTNERFNYNLKRLGFETALMENDCVIQLDTDIYIKGGLDLNVLNDVEDGLYLKWRNVVNNKLELSSDIEYLYIDKIREMSGLDELFFIDESTLIFKITDTETKNKLISYWNQIYQETINLQPNYRNEGAVEGVIIYASTILSGLNVYDKLGPLFNNFLHYLKKDGGLNLEKSVI